MRRSTQLGAWLTASIVACAACGDDGGSSHLVPGPAGVASGGAQDFGAFRALLDKGEIPGPGSLDSVGFFNEHKIELPDPDCGQLVCLQHMLGTMGNLITGASCTMLVIGMNTAFDPSILTRRSLDVTFAIDTSGSMQGTPIARVREGLLRMLDALHPGDRVSLVTFDNQAQVLAEAQEVSAPGLQSAINALSANGATNLYDGLRTAYDLADRRRDVAHETRVVLLSDGEATTGLQTDSRIIELARSYAEQGIALSTIGLGTEFDPLLMRTLAETGAGTFYFIENADAVREVFSEEVQLTLFPLAQHARIRLTADAGYDLRALYGARLFKLDAGQATIDLPTLYIAERESANDNANGRRGGGGVMIAELVPTDGRSPPSDGDAQPVAQLDLSYDEPATGMHQDLAASVSTLVDPDDALEDGFFDAPGVEKAFVALNVYAGFETASQAAATGDYGTAVVTLDALGDSVKSWLKDNPDPDIEDDLESMEKLTTLLQDKATQLVKPVNPPDPWPRD
jgi:Ca-activated chloride channel family protein